MAFSLECVLSTSAGDILLNLFHTLILVENPDFDVTGVTFESDSIHCATIYMRFKISGNPDSQ